MNPHYQLVMGDSLPVLKGMEDECVDLVVTDVPYESLEAHRAKGSTTRLTKEWFQVISNDTLADYIHEFYRVLKPDTHAYIMCDQPTHYHIRDAGIKAGFIFKKCLIFDKVLMGMGYSYRCQHEFICYLEKGKRRLNNLGISDVLSYKRVRNGYPTEKPVDLSVDLILNSSNQGDTVLDTFVGSGSTMQAALQTGRNIIGMELKPSQEAKIVDRLHEYTRSDDLIVPRKQMMLANL